jgi:hypothetical protein
MLITFFLSRNRKARMKMDLSPTQKANIRKRLKAADDVVMKIQQSGVECNALVSRVSREKRRFPAFLYIQEPS